MNIPKKFKKFQKKDIPLSICFAKTIKKQNYLIPGCNVFTHCYLSGLVAKKIIEIFPCWLKNKLFPEGTPLIVSVHDIGKVSSFQEDIYKNLGYTLNIFPSMENKIYHNEVSQAALSHTNKKIAKITGRHHGFSPRNIQEPNAEIYGGESWQKLREELFPA